MNVNVKGSTWHVRAGESLVCCLARTPLPECTVLISSNRVKSHGIHMTVCMCLWHSHICRKKQSVAYNILHTDSGTHKCHESALWGHVCALNEVSSPSVSDDGLRYRRCYVSIQQQHRAVCAETWVCPHHEGHNKLLCVCMCVCVRVRIRVCPAKTATANSCMVYLCGCASMGVFPHPACNNKLLGKAVYELCIPVCLYACRYVCIRAWGTSMHTCMHVCMHVCKFACMFALRWECISSSWEGQLAARIGPFEAHGLVFAPARALCVHVRVSLGSCAWSTCVSDRTDQSRQQHFVCFDLREQTCRQKLALQASKYLTAECHTLCWMIWFEGQT